MRVVSAEACSWGAFFFAMSLFLFIEPALANNPFVENDELNRLPEWCSYYPWVMGSHEPAKKNASPQVKAAIALVTSGCYGPQHYCWALVYANRGDSAVNSRQRNTNYRLAFPELDFVGKSSNTKESCILIPEMLLKRGELHAKLGEYPSAVRNYRLAILRNPKEVRAYSGLSRVYQLMGSKKEALATLQDGVKANPKSNLLKKRLAELQND